MAYRYEELKETKEYKELQKDFLQKLVLAASFVKQNKVEKAKELLGLYSKIEEKRYIISLLFLHQEKFLEFIKYAANGDVMEAYAIAKEDKRYEKLSLYKELVDKIERTFKRLERAIDELEFDVELLLEQMSLHPKAKKLQQKLQKAKELSELFEGGEIVRCYEFIEQEELVQNNILAKKLTSHYYKTIRLSQEYVYNGDVKGVVEKLGILLKVSSKQKQIGLLLKKTFKTKIIQLLKRKEYQEAERGCYKYVELFGKDLLFDEVAKEFEQKSGIKLALVPECEQKENRWTELIG